MITELMIILTVVGAGIVIFVWTGSRRRRGENFEQEEVAESTAKFKQELENTANEKEVAKIKKRIEEIDKLILKIYEDNAFGRISDERFTSLSESLEIEQKELKQRLTEIAAYKRKMNNKAVVTTVQSGSCKCFTVIPAAGVLWRF